MKRLAKLLLKRNLKKKKKSSKRITSLIKKSHWKRTIKVCRSLSKKKNLKKNIVMRRRNRLTNMRKKSMRKRNKASPNNWQLINLRMSKESLINKKMKLMQTNHKKIKMNLIKIIKNSQKICLISLYIFSSSKISSSKQWELFSFK